MRIIVFSVALFLTGCIITPHTKQVYDYKCDSFRTKVSLQTEYIVRGCNSNDDCSALIGGSIFIGAISGTISAIVMLVGNTYYAIDHSRKCKTKIDSRKMKIQKTQAKTPQTD
jgi:hypothetical protein